MAQDVVGDWKNREFIETVEIAVRKCVDFLNNFHESAKYRLSVVDARLSTLERKLDFLEASLENADPSQRQAKPAPFKGSIFDPQIRKKLIEQNEQKKRQNKRLFNKIVVAPNKSSVSRTIINAPSAQPQQQQKRKVQQQPPPKPGPAAAVPLPVVRKQPPRNPVAKKQQQPPPNPLLQKQQKPPPNPLLQKQQKPPPNPLLQKQQKQQKPPPNPMAVPPNPMQNKPKPKPQPEIAKKPPPIPGQLQQQPPPNPMKMKKKLAGPGAPPVAPSKPPQPPKVSPKVPPAPGAAARPPPGPGAAPPQPHQWPNKAANQIDILVVSPGNGAIPGGQSAVEIEYTGHLKTGKQFIQHREVIQLGKKQNIKGLEQAVTRIKVGSTIKLWIPSRLAYGARGAGDLIPPNSNLTFHLKLHRIVKQ
eukprot:363610_1